MAWLALLGAALVVGLGPLAVPELDLSISHPSRLLVSSVVSGGLALVAAGGPSRLLDLLARSSSPYVGTVVFGLVLLALLIVSRGATAVGGADSAGYLAQAHRWHAGIVRTALPLHIAGADDPWLQSGLGFRPDPSGEATVPSYPPGLPWLQAIALSLGGDVAAIRGVPLLAASLALCAVFLLARLVAGIDGAALATVVFCTLPVFLFQALQPMSDVPALALWLLCLALAARPGLRPLLAAALAGSVAVLVRPNLAPLALPVLWLGAQSARDGAETWRRLGTLAVGFAMAAAGVAAVQATLFGSPLQSGYGRASELFSLRHVPTNLVLYPGWVIESVSRPGLAMLCVGAIVLARAGARSVAARPLLLMAGTTTALYAVYVPFDSWTYLRFVLIALAMAAVGAGALLTDAPGTSRAPWRFPVFAALVLLVGLPNLQRAQALGVFAVRAREHRYEAAGRFVQAALPADVVIVAAQHSASAQLYAGRPLLRADLLDAHRFALVSAWAAREGRPLAFVLDVAEVEAIGTSLGRDGLGALDWPPRAEIGRPVATRIWLSTDRAPWIAGASIGTIRLLPPAR